MTSLPLGLGRLGEQRGVDLIGGQASHGEESGGALGQRSAALQAATHQFLLQDVQTQTLQLLHGGGGRHVHTHLRTASSSQHRQENGLVTAEIQINMKDY